MGLTSLSNVVTGPIEYQILRVEYMVCGLTVIPYKHDRSRHPNIPEFLKIRDRLTNLLKRRR